VDHATRGVAGRAKSLRRVPAQHLYGISGIRHVARPVAGVVIPTTARRPNRVGAGTMEFLTTR
jgi:hypothetical protein